MLIKLMLHDSNYTTKYKNMKILRVLFTYCIWGIFNQFESDKNSNTCDNSFVFLHWSKHDLRKEGKEKHALFSIYSLFPCHCSFLQSTCFPNSNSPSSVTEHMDLTTIPPRIEAKTKTHKNLLPWHFVPSHLNARQSQWTGVWGICVEIAMVMALCLPRLPGGCRVGGREEGAVMEQVGNHASTKLQWN